MLSDEIGKLGNARINRRVTVEGAAIAPGHHSDYGPVHHQWTAGISLAGIDAVRTGTQMERPDRSEVLIRKTANGILHNRNGNFLEAQDAGSLVLKKGSELKITSIEANWFIFTYSDPHPAIEATAPWEIFRLLLGNATG